MGQSDDLLNQGNRPDRGAQGKKEMPKAAADLKNLLLEVKGNPELDSRYDWSAATVLPNKSVRVTPVDKNNPSLLIVPTESMLREMIGTREGMAAAASYQRPKDQIVVLAVEAALKSSGASGTNPDIDRMGIYERIAMAALDGGPFDRTNQDSPKFDKVNYEGFVAHESQHAMGSALSEYSAYRKSFDHLAANGEIKPVSKDTILKTIFLTYDGSDMALSVMEAYNGDVKAAAEWMPGGAKLKEAAASLKFAADKEFGSIGDTKPPDANDARNHIAYRVEGARSELALDASQYSGSFMNGLLRYSFHQAVQQEAKASGLNRKEEHKLAEVLNKRVLREDISTEPLAATAEKAMKRLMTNFAKIRVQLPSND
jgi:hypothetical protein